MTEYEAATLAIRSAGLWAAYGQIAATVAIGLGQIAVVAWGIRAMQRATERRADEARNEARRRDAADQRRADADERRHAEAMANHAEAMANHTEAMANHAEAMARLDQQGRALETLIARTAPAAD